MYLSQLQVFNFKSFRQSDVLSLKPGFNVLIGPNNSGKTALIEALGLNFSAKTHVSLSTIPYVGAPVDPNSRAEITFQFSAEELRQLYIDLGFFDLPVLPGEAFETARILFEDALATGDTLFTSWQNPWNTNPPLTAAWLESMGARSRPDKYLRMMGNRVNDQFETLQQHSEPDFTSSYSFKLAIIARQRIYVFKAERLNIGVSNFGTATALVSNAENLPECLNILQDNKAQFERYIEYVRAIFPEITHVSVRPHRQTGNRVEIRVWTIPTETERSDLAIPLDESGTGISQVLAILYVVLTAPFPQVIVIDEPQSFLHPGATRKLIEILRRDFSQHQFIVTTHSPEVISAAQPEVVIRVYKEGSESKTAVANQHAAKDMELLLSEVGTRLSDVFGADNILWVEGPTEELCFPRILERLTNTHLRGTKILGVKKTGDFSKKQVKSTIEIYKQLSQSGALIPPALGFLFDLENRSPKEIKELKSMSEGHVHFLNRRMYENYLLNPEAIADVISRLEHFRESQVTAEEISDWIEKNRWNSKYFNGALEDSDKNLNIWQKSVDGAKLLMSMFAELSETRYEYDKIAYGLELTEWKLENSPQGLQEVADLLSAIVGGQQQLQTE